MQHTMVNGPVCRFSLVSNGLSPCWHSMWVDAKFLMIKIAEPKGILLFIWRISSIFTLPYTIHVTLSTISWVIIPFIILTTFSFIPHIFDISNPLDTTIFHFVVLLRKLRVKQFQHFIFKLKRPHKPDKLKDRGQTK